MRQFIRRIDKTIKRLPSPEPESFAERLCITISVGAACILSSLFYWLLPPIARVLIVPVFVGVAWWVGARILYPITTPQGSAQFFDFFKADELRCLVEAVLFSAATVALAAMPFVLMPLQFHAALVSPEARTLFLGMFIWNLIGAPLYAQARDKKACLLIILVFALPSATSTLWWTQFLDALNAYF